MSNIDLLHKLLSDDPHHIYTDEELDAIEEIDVSMALRLARAQHFANANVERVIDESVDIDLDLLNQAIDEVKKILSSDGGDIELVNLTERTVNVRMKGACVGCPNAPLDLKNVVEKIIFDQVPGVRAIQNVF